MATDTPLEMRIDGIHVFMLHLDNRFLLYVDELDLSMLMQAQYLMQWKK